MYSRLPLRWLTVLSGTILTVAAPLLSHAGDRFFTGDKSDKIVYKYHEAVTASGNFAVSAVSAPDDVAVNENFVYVLDNSLKRVSRYSYVGAGVVHSRSLKQTGGSDIGSPYGMAVIDDELWVTDDTLKIYRFGLTAAFTGSGTINASNQYNFQGANVKTNGLAVDSTYLYNLDGEDRVVYRYLKSNPAGAMTVSKGLRNASGGNLVTTAEGVAVEGSTIWVVNNANRTVFTYDLVSMYNGVGTTLTALAGTVLPSPNSDPRGIAVNANPSVVSIVRADTDPTNAASVSFTVTFSENVTGVGTGDFTLTTTGGISGATVTGTGADAGSNVRTVTVGTGSGSGTIRLDFVDDDSVVGSGSQPIGGTGAGNGSFTSGEFYTVDTTPPTSSASVTDQTRAGVAVLTVDFIAADADSSVASTRLYVKEPGSEEFEDTGLSESGTGGSFTYTVPVTVPVTDANGLYEFATRALDTVGNEEAEPTTEDTHVLLNRVENGEFTQSAVTGNDLLVFPMTDDKDVTIQLNGATAGKFISVSRTPVLVNPHAYFRHSGKLIGESLDITPEASFGGSNHTISWPFDPANAAGLGADPVDAAYGFEGTETPTSTLSATRVGDTVIITGVNSFSTWYVGSAVAVPVSVSAFSIE